VSRRLFLTVGAAATLVTGGSGCATRADLDQISRNQQQARRVIADQTVAIEEMRRRIEMLQASMEDGGRAPASGGDTQWRRGIENRLAAIERNAVNQVPPAGEMVPPGAMPGAGMPGSGLPPAGMPPAAVPGAQSAPGAVAPAPAPVPAAAPAAGGSSLAADVAREEAALAGAQVSADYRGALALVRQGNCKDAVPQLRTFVRKDIKSPWADNAQYWIGRCFYTQGDYNRAIMELYDVLLKFPKSERVPAALLTLADSFADSGDPIDARLTLKKLLSDHPQAEEAAAARKRLQALGE
jgi:tol-pal system protein YbgF